MSFNKKILAAAIVSGLFVTTAHADVNISDGDDAVTIASELDFDDDGELALSDAAAFDLTTALSYSFSAGEVRYARIECSDNLLFTSASVAVGPTPTDADIGAVNGIGTNAISFSITAAPDNAGVPVLTGTDEITIDGTRTLTSADAVSCTYSLYDQPSQAQAGGATGRIATESGEYLAFASSYLYDIDSLTSTANVEADPSFSRFVASGATTAGVATLADVAFDTRANLSDDDQPVIANGTASTLAGILAAGTAHVVEGDFSAAANNNGTFTGAAEDRVFIVLDGNGTCAAPTVPANVVSATSLTATSATFVVGDIAVNGLLCYAPNATRAIPVSEYTFTLDPVSEDGYTAGPLGPVASGEIVRNGTEIQAPLAQVPAGYQSRIALTNTGSTPRTYSVEILLETGNTRNGDPNQLTGTIPANSLHVVELATLMGTFTAAPRGTVNVTVAGPSNQIQGLYQIVNPANGSISNHVMVRPDSN